MYLVQLPQPTQKQGHPLLLYVGNTYMAITYLENTYMVDISPSGEYPHGQYLHGKSLHRIINYTRRSIYYHAWISVAEQTIPDTYLDEYRYCSLLTRNLCESIALKYNM